MASGLRDIKSFAAEARGARGQQLAGLVREVLSAGHIFSFGELLLVPSVQELRNSEHSDALNTLELFAYGTLKDYTSQKEKYLELSEGQINRLKMLTLVTLAFQQKELHYNDLHKELDTSSLRELEDLVIDAVYHDLLSAKIDQKNETLRIISCTSRDITTKHIDDILGNVTAWREKVVQLMSSIEDNSEIISSQRKTSLEESDTIHHIIGMGLKEMLSADDMNNSTVNDSGLGGSRFLGLGQSSLLGRARPKRSRGHQSVR